MTDEKILKEIADPIIEQLKEASKQIGSNTILQIPKIKFIMDPEMESLDLGDIKIDEEFLKDLEEYIQEELEMISVPTMLH